jgi:hypothetical protein
MKKGLMFAIMMVLLVGTVVAQTPQAKQVSGQITATISEMLQNVIEINEKTCSDKGLLLTQEASASDGLSFYTKVAFPGNLLELPFVLIFPNKEGSLQSIENSHVYGVLSNNADVGDTCNILLNNVQCLTLVKTEPLGEEEYFYETLSQSCTDSLMEGEINYMGVNCPTIHSDGYIKIYKLHYDTIWNSCQK